MSAVEESTAPRSEPLLRTLVGGVLRRTRAAQGRTLQDVATQARISIAYLSEVERGRKEASSEVLVAVCRALDIRLVDLLAQSTSQLLAADLATDLGARRRAGSLRAARPRVLDLTDDSTVVTVVALTPTTLTAGSAGPEARLSVA